MQGLMNLNLQTPEDSWGVMGVMTQDWSATLAARAAAVVPVVGFGDVKFTFYILHVNHM